jgi:TP901 family phage tail tape measure protein
MKMATASTSEFSAKQIATAQKTRAMYTGLGLAGLAFGGALAFGLKNAADAAIEFESSFAGVRKTVDGTEGELQVISDALREMATVIPVNVNELNRIAESAGQLGIQKSGIIDFTEVVAKLGVTTTLATEDAASGLARVANIMGTAEGDFGRLGATLVDLGNKGASTESEILQMGLRIAGAGKVVGLTESEVLGFANALSSVGVEAQAGGSSISRAFIGIADSVANGGEKLEIFAQVAGMTAAEFSTAFEQDAAGAMVTFIEGLARVQASGGNVFGVLDKLGLSEIRVRDAMLRAAGAGDLFRESIENGSVAWEENSALNEEAAKRFETTASKIQLAKNQINEAAIAFGGVLLPAIAAVMGAVGDFAGFIGDLPGPLRVVAVVLAAAASAMALLAGATLLILPRLIAVQTQFAAAGIQAGLFKGSLQFAAKAINPWTVGIAAATIGLGYFITKHAEGKQRIEELTASLEENTGAVTENTRVLAAHRLQEEGALDAARRFGIELDTMVDAALGNADAVATVYAAIADPQRNLITSADRVRTSVGGVSDELAVAQANAKQEAEAVGGTADAHDEAGGAAGEHAGALEGLGDVEKEVLSLTDRLTNAFEQLAGTQLDARKTALAWAQSIADTRKELRAGTKTLDQSTQAGRDNQSQILDSIDAAIEDGKAVAEATGSRQKGIRVVQDHIQQLMAEAVAAGFSKEEIRAYIRQLNLTPKDIRTLLHLQGTDTAQNAFDAFMSRNQDRILYVRTQLVEGGGSRGGVQTGHAGGTVGALGARRMHQGGDLRSDEQWFIGQKGERVLSVAEMRMLSSIVGTPAAPTSPQPTRNGKEIRIGLNLDRRRFTTELDHDATYAGRWSG